MGPGYPGTTCADGSHGTAPSGYVQLLEVGRRCPVPPSLRVPWFWRAVVRLCGQRSPSRSQIPQLCFGFTILVISAIHNTVGTVGTWIKVATYVLAGTGYLGTPTKTPLLRPYQYPPTAVLLVIVERPAVMLSGTIARGAP